MFYVYRRDHYAEYEPAEGGYYVDCSEISAVEEYAVLADACEALLDWCNEVETEDCAEPYSGSWKFGLVGTFGLDDYYLRMPYFRYDYHGYIGEGFELGISVDEPKDEPYGGYC